MLAAVPKSTQEAVPIEPGTSTGCPSARYSSGTSRAPGPNARVAPLRWTHTFTGRPSI
jgi:hypothetical protein